MPYQKVKVCSLWIGKGKQKKRIHHRCSMVNPGSVAQPSLLEKPELIRMTGHYQNQHIHRDQLNQNKPALSQFKPACRLCCFLCVDAEHRNLLVGL